MLTKLIIDSACRAVSFLGNISAAPFIMSSKRRLSIQIIHPRWRYILWQVLTLVVLPIQLIDGYYNIITEASKVKQGSANLTYLTVTVFYTAVATFSVFLNSNLAVNMSYIQQTMRQAFLVDEYLMSEFRIRITLQYWQVFRPRCGGDARRFEHLSKYCNPTANLRRAIARLFSYPSFTLPFFCREGSNFYPSSFSLLLGLIFAVSFTFLQKGEILAQISTIIISLLNYFCLSARNFRIKIQLFKSIVIWQWLLFAGYRAN